MIPDEPYIAIRAIALVSGVGGWSKLLLRRHRGECEYTKYPPEPARIPGVRLGNAGGLIPRDVVRGEIQRVLDEFGPVLIKSKGLAIVLNDSEAQGRR